MVTSHQEFISDHFSVIGASEFRIVIEYNTYAPRAIEKELYENAYL
ncbi:hypothetical protein THF1C08_170022 [Vibrio jasicida]|uniref:Uncharacterized protein n=1 Tax=Vibrio jasicida TaxID=766224 RepID=A0AAU9QKS0_9VIBR|nr:hypothetical protein THF1C08_170022 [Vibrio jasicida]CAH1579745.1 hypothetical protein THF1A12_160022 [Vibrio jasicida]